MVVFLSREVADLQHEVEEFFAIQPNSFLRVQLRQRKKKTGKGMCTSAALIMDFLILRHVKLY